MKSHTEIDLRAGNQELDDKSAENRILWAVERFGHQAVMLSSMQKTASIIMHMFHRLGLTNDVIFVDTGFHFHETLRTRDEFIRGLGLNIVTVYPELTPLQQETRFGKKLHLYVDGQPECCRLRKEEPFLSYMRAHGRRLTINGLRASEGGRRAKLQPLERDPRVQGYSLYPLFDWTDAKVFEYLTAHGVPVHPLHDKGYPSIGCECCTTPVRPGEDARAGRWRHLREPGAEGPQYCGLNFIDGEGI